jgi:hypothetical protein
MGAGEPGTVTVSTAPEPSTLVLLGLGGGLALLDYVRRYRRRAVECRTPPRTSGPRFFGRLGRGEVAG